VLGSAGNEQRTIGAEINEYKVVVFEANLGMVTGD
jgi:hypothetical protein